MSKMVTMNDAYISGFSGNGVFTDLQSLDIPWKEENISGSLDVLYYSLNGEKSVTNIIDKRLNSDGYLDNANRAAIATALYTMFSVKWSKLYETLSFEYDPIENYRMVEEEGITVSQMNTSTDSGTIDRDGSNSRSDSGTIENDGEVADIINKVYGFNSSNAVNSDTSSNTVDNTETHDLTFGETIDETETHDLTFTDERHNSTGRELTRSGNIGVTTSQQMIESERRLWQWNYFNSVFEDVNSILCLDIYETECV